MNDKSAPTLRDRRGRAPSGAAVMQSSVTLALTRALFIEWARHGYARLSLDAVARRARVGKAALYRRWPSKTAMVMDRLREAGLGLTDIAEGASLNVDVRAFLGAMRTALERPLVRRIVTDLNAELPYSEELRTFFETFQVERRLRAEPILRRAVIRGELSQHLDIELALDFLAAPLYWHIIVLRNKADDAYLDRLTKATVCGISTMRTDMLA